MKKFIPLLVLTSLAFAESTPRITNGATIAVEPISPESAAWIANNQPEKNLLTNGERKEGNFRIAMTGAVMMPGFYFLEKGASLADALAAAGGFGRLATSRFTVRREGKVFRVTIGTSHGIAPIAKELLPLFLLKEGDVVWTSEVSPY